MLFSSHFVFVFSLGLLNIVVKFTHAWMTMAKVFQNACQSIRVLHGEGWVRPFQLNLFPAGLNPDMLYCFHQNVATDIVIHAMVERIHVPGIIFLLYL